MKQEHSVAIEAINAIRMLTGSDQKDIQQAATKALEVRTKYEEGLLTESEVKDLIDDITDITTINTSMLTEDVMVEIRNAFNTILTLKNLVSLI